MIDSRPARAGVGDDVEYRLVDVAGRVMARAMLSNPPMHAGACLLIPTGQGSPRCQRRARAAAITLTPRCPMTTPWPVHPRIPRAFQKVQVGVGRRGQARVDAVSPLLRVRGRCEASNAHISGTGTTSAQNRDANSGTTLPCPCLTLPCPAAAREVTPSAGMLSIPTSAASPPQLESYHDLSSGSVHVT